jgi:diguanylate cyclase (GGDEF)-like protein
LRAPALEAGWTLISLQLVTALAATLTTSRPWDAWLQIGLAASGYALLAVGLVRSPALFVGSRQGQQDTRDATHDRLTSLANRARFLDELALRWSGLEPASRSSIAVAFIDFDGFKAINDRYGRLVGDELLRIVGRRLRAAVREQDLVARVGGDELAALITGLSDNEALDALLARVHGRLTRKAVVNGAAITPYASIGVARGSEQHARPKDLLRAAEAAMYTAKRARLGRGPSAAA